MQMGPKVNVSADGSSLVMANAGRSNGETSVNLVQKNSGCSSARYGSHRLIPPAV